MTFLNISSETSNPKMKSRLIFHFRPIFHFFACKFQISLPFRVGQGERSSLVVVVVVSRILNRNVYILYPLGVNIPNIDIDIGCRIPKIQIPILQEKYTVYPSINHKEIWRQEHQRK